MILHAVPPYTLHAHAHVQVIHYAPFPLSEDEQEAKALSESTRAHWSMTALLGMDFSVSSRANQVKFRILNA